MTFRLAVSLSDVKKKTKKVPKKISMLRLKYERLYISFLGAFFPTPPLLIPYFYDVTEELSSSSLKMVSTTAALLGARY